MKCIYSLCWFCFLFSLMVPHDLPGRDDAVLVDIQEVDQKRHQLGVRGCLLGQDVSGDVVPTGKEESRC